MKVLVDDALWERIQPLLPPPPQRRFRFPGRKPLDYRMVLTGILFVLKTGMAWDDLPAELGCGCGKTCRHYLQIWHQAGVWVKLHAVLLAELNGADQIDWSRALIDATFAKAPEGGEDTGPNPTDRGKSGSKHQSGRKLWSVRSGWNRRSGGSQREDSGAWSRRSWCSMRRRWRLSIGWTKPGRALKSPWSTRGRTAKNTLRRNCFAREGWWNCSAPRCEARPPKNPGCGKATACTC